jgi:hypothetical protein
MRLQSGITPNNNVVLSNRSGVSTWESGHLVFGGLHHIWVDANNKLRIKSGVPASDSDGGIVGTQS